MIPPSMYGRAMSVVKFIMQETGTYNQQYRRPYQTNSNAAVENQILETVDQKRSISAASLATVASQFIQPSATPEEEIHIANGWNTKRYRFLLEVQSVDRTGLMATKEFIVGYTDHPDISYGGHFDPNMVFYINAINVTREHRTTAPTGSQMHQAMIDSSHILVNNQYSNLEAPNQLFGLRPEDVYDQIDNRVLKKHITDGFVVDGRTKITTSATKSNRANAVAPTYMASVLDSYLQTARNQKDDSDTVIMEAARSTVQSSSVSEDPFMSFVRGCQGGTGGNAFTLRDLLALDPNAMPTLAPMNDGLRASLHQTGLTSHWGGADMHTLWATTLSQSVPSYMLQFGFTRLQLTATNMDIGSQIHVTPTHVRSFNQGFDVSRELQALIFRLETELLKNLSQNNMLSFGVEIDCDLLGETKCWISINGSPVIDFVMPSFCDALMAPVTTRNFMTLDGAANDFSSLMQKVYENDAAHSAGGIMRTGVI